MMDLKDFGKKLAELGLPLLGAALPIPGGAAIGAVLAKAIGARSEAPEDILDILTANPEMRLKARQIEMEHEEEIHRILLEHEAKMRAAESADLAQVNETIREEIRNSASEEWYQKSWRPFNGYSFGVVLLLNYGLPAIFNTIAPVFDPQWRTVVPSPIPESVFLAWGAVLGVTAWHRGLMQRGSSGKSDA